MYRGRANGFDANRVSPVNGTKRMGIPNRFLLNIGLSPLALVEEEIFDIECDFGSRSEIAERIQKLTLENAKAEHIVDCCEALAALAKLYTKLRELRQAENPAPTECLGIFGDD